MKKIFLLFAFFYFSTLSFGQKYKYGAATIGGMNLKIEGTISIDDSIVIIGGGDKNLKFKRIKSSNDIVYFTDGVMTNYFLISPQKGKKKGFEYETMIIYNLDKKIIPNMTTIYWCIKLKDE